MLRMYEAMLDFLFGKAEDESPKAYVDDYRRTREDEELGYTKRLLIAMARQELIIESGDDDWEPSTYAIMERYYQNLEERYLLNEG